MDGKKKIWQMSYKDVMQTKIKEWMFPVIFTLIIGAIAVFCGIRNGRKELKQKSSEYNVRMNK